MATEATEELYRVRDTYFPTDPADKASKIQTLADAALAELDSIPLGKKDQATLVDESIKHAKEAVMLDIKDGNSWCKILLFLS
ncbi:hypothetical protein FCM35_KLT16910 [Carex littledalei]|uniref:Uncharacterized protein n=1 Tax=Carex littledalei TaxID=544730 RepID=A0A833RUA5_9POAL|nr:hypothetical protein FCM35_KLT16910 [Carex littledalei]